MRHGRVFTKSPKKSPTQGFFYNWVTVVQDWLGSDTMAIASITLKDSQNGDLYTLPYRIILGGSANLTLRLTSMARLPSMSAPLTLLFSSQLRFA
jgi:hypothetical protein